MYNYFTQDPEALLMVGLLAGILLILYNLFLHIYKPKNMENKISIHTKIRHDEVFGEIISSMNLSNKTQNLFICYNSVQHTYSFQFMNNLGLDITTQISFEMIQKDPDMVCLILALHYKSPLIKKAIKRFSASF
jgi:hypothetical protein